MNIKRLKSKSFVATQFERHHQAAVTLVKIVSHTRGDAAEDLHPTILLSVYSVQNYTAFPYPDFLSSSIIYFQHCTSCSQLCRSSIYFQLCFRDSQMLRTDYEGKLLPEAGVGFQELLWVGAKAKMIFSQTAAPCPDDVDLELYRAGNVKIRPFETFYLSKYEIGEVWTKSDRVKKLTDVAQSFADMRTR